jgi:hypothetical protein
VRTVPPESVPDRPAFRRRVRLFSRTRVSISSDCSNELRLGLHCSHGFEQMTTNSAPFANHPGARARRANLYSWALGAFLGVVLTLILMGVLVWESTGLGLSHFMGALRGQSTQFFKVDQPTVVRQIQQLQRLETVSYTADKIISGEHANAYLPNFLAGDRLLLVAHGEVIGGINLAALQTGDVTIQGERVSIRLPPAEILSTRIDSAKTKVFSRETGLFSSPDPNLESEVREEAERELQQAALQDGILKTARDNAGSTIAGMLKGFGFRDVEIR